MVLYNVCCDDDGWDNRGQRYAHGYSLRKGKNKSDGRYQGDYQGLATFTNDAMINWKILMRNLILSDTGLVSPLLSCLDHCAIANYGTVPSP